MSNGKLTIRFVRRGYSASGGAEAYLTRLARGLAERGHEARLVTTRDWPKEAWPFGEMMQLRSRSPIGFANELEELRPQLNGDVLVSLERVCSCDVYRAGDGVHRAWLQRRARIESPWEKLLHRFNVKHRELLRLEKSLLDDRGAERVITNSQMVKNEIIEFYNYRRDRIEVVRNGVPLTDFQFDPRVREKARAGLGLGAEDTAVLFVGTGWERKGLRYAVDAIEKSPRRKMRLLVAGRGNQARYAASRVRFLGSVTDLRPIYSAADIFLLPTIYDPFSNACLEALACGLPVITTRGNGFSEIMENQIHGAIIDQPNDIVALTSALEQWADPTWRSAARSSILKRAAQFDITRNVEKTLDVLLQAARAAAPASGNIRNT